MKLIDLAIEEENKKMFVDHRDKHTLIKNECPHRMEFYKTLCKSEVSGVMAECVKKTIDCEDCWNQEIENIS